MGAGVGAVTAAGVGAGEASVSEICIGFAVVAVSTSISTAVSTDTDILSSAPETSVIPHPANMVITADKITIILFMFLTAFNILSVRLF